MISFLLQTSTLKAVTAEDVESAIRWESYDASDLFDKYANEQQEIKKRLANENEMLRTQLADANKKIAVIEEVFHPKPTPTPVKTISAFYQVKDKKIVTAHNGSVYSQYTLEDSNGVKIQIYPRNIINPLNLDLNVTEVFRKDENGFFFPTSMKK